MVRANTLKTNKMQEILNNIENQVQHNANQGNSTSDRHWSSEVGVLLTVEDARALAERIKELEEGKPLKGQVFELANKLAIADHGTQAVAMHRIHNSL